jgi:hypothetical protein
LRHCATSRKVAGSIPDKARPQYGRGFDSTSNRNEYQDYFQRDKGGRCVWLTALPPSCVECLEMWEPVQVSRGIPLLVFQVGEKN